jgi:hypothetical protein
LVIAKSSPSQRQVSATSAIPVPFRGAKKDPARDLLRGKAVSGHQSSLISSKLHIFVLVFDKRK